MPASDASDLLGFASAALAALCFGSYTVPMKGEVATRVDVDPLVFQTYKAVAVFVTSLLLVAFCNLMHGTHPDSFDYWSFADFTHWAFVSAIFWVPGGTAGVFAVRRAGLAISTGLWSCVIILLSYLWGVLIFHEKQESAVGAVGAVLLMCVGLIGIAHFSSIEVRPGLDQARAAPRSVEECRPACSDETTPLNGINRANDAQFDLAKLTSQLPGLFAAVLNGLFAASIMLPLHYAPPNTTKGIGYSMSFGIAAVVVVFIFWTIRLLALTAAEFAAKQNEAKRITPNIIRESLREGYSQLPSFHFSEMWRPGFTAGLLYSGGNLFGIVSIQHLGNFMGYSLNQSSMIISGCWGLFWYRESE
ncbi:hypothetical protein THAOC_17910 [Thalassiosira oceanica]|uniref:EamA domain-containing protein n=1 Tax=Thalassiosira oceanica TaxID=159749 RepID=K0SKT7_THAOC|nr:hypothetical protein THAOC_17910 [Thalassiosira oceanica]|eukprot:EJK61576.1 hypothetical protein THAOC_17910 [Thalassiosira oceanica]